MLPAPLRRHVHDGTFQQLQQRLLDTLARHIACNRRILRAFAGDLINLVNKDDAAFRLLHIVIGGLQQTRKNALHIFAHITRLREHCRIRNTERHFQQIGYRFGQQCFTRTRLPYQQNVALLNIHIGVGLVHTLHQPFVVVIHGHGKHLLGLFLSDDIIVQTLFDLFGFQQIQPDVGNLFLLRFGGMLMVNVHCRLQTIAAYHRVKTANDELVARNITTTEAARSIEILFFCHSLKNSSYYPKKSVLLWVQTLNLTNHHSPPTTNC